MLIQELTFELFEAILDEIELVRQLVQCRLACRNWNAIAEKVMFGKHIHLITEKQILQLTAHLAKNPDNGKLIKHLYFISDYNREEYLNDKIFADLLELAFTLNTVNLKEGSLQPHLHKND